MSSQPPLTPKQENFCREYIIDFAGRSAAVRAGYAPRSAEVAASRLLKNDKIQARIAELQRPQLEKLEISAEKVLEELALIAFARPKKYMSWNNSSLTLVDSEDLTEPETAAIAEVNYKSIETQFGGTTQISLKFHDKVKALSTILERYLDMDCAIALLNKRGYDAVPKILPAVAEQPANDAEAGEGEESAGEDSA